MKKIIRLLAVCALLGACSSNASEITDTTVCTLDLGYLKTTTTFDYDKGKNEVLKQTTENVMNLTETQIDKEQLEAEIETVKNLYDMKGITYTYEFDGDILTETTIIDYREANFKDLLEIDIISSVDGKTPTYIDYEATIESVEATGLTCK